jgi:hypothetical protein
MTVTDQKIVSSATVHRAHRFGAGWRVSWLPGRPLTREQAISAMRAAETVATMVSEEAKCDHPLWSLLDSVSADLGLSGPEVMVRVTEGTPRHRPHLATINRAVEEAVEAVRQFCGADILPWQQAEALLAVWVHRDSLNDHARVQVLLRLTGPTCRTCDAPLVDGGDQ